MSLESPRASVRKIDLLQATDGYFPNWAISNSGVQYCLLPGFGEHRHTPRSATKDQFGGGRVSSRNHP
jgi:hypothetical protein